jgi:hypothetical protein
VTPGWEFGSMAAFAAAALTAGVQPGTAANW